MACSFAGQFEQVTGTAAAVVAGVGVAALISRARPAGLDPIEALRYE